MAVVTFEGVNEGKKSSKDRCVETTKPRLSNILLATKTFLAPYSKSSLISVVLNWLFSRHKLTAAALGLITDVRFAKNFRSVLRPYFYRIADCSLTVQIAFRGTVDRTTETVRSVFLPFYANVT